MPDEPTRSDASQHLDEFRARVQDLRQHGGDVWESLLDLGLQVSVVRHDVVNLRQAAIIHDYKLYGDDGEGGKFGEMRRDLRDQTVELKRDIKDVSRAVEEAARQVSASATAAADKLRQEAEAHAQEQRERVQWWERWWARAGVIVAMLSFVGTMALTAFNALK